ncbi:MAG: hypothetical protein ING32_15145 [Curvibacter sp.]|jgi:hypothetical protein|nr:hypothetical protein [Curvibacter sp.]
MSSENKHSNRSRGWRWIVYLLVGLSIASGYAFWKFQSTKNQLFGFQPPEMALAQYTPKDVIGDLGGMKVRIPRHYAEYVEYDGDPGFGEQRKGPVPERTFESRLRSFGIDVRFPDMKGLENQTMRDEHRSYDLNPENPWISIGINAGEIYPGLGAKAREGRAKKLWERSEYWWNNYARLPSDIYGLEAYVPSGTDPKTGKPARESDSTYDIYIHRDTSGHVDIYIQCGRTSVPGGISSCGLEFGLEPKAEVAVTVRFYPKLLQEWKTIKESVTGLFLSFEVKETSATGNAVPSPASSFK